MSNNLIKMRETFDPESIDRAAPLDHDGLVDCRLVEKTGSEKSNIIDPPSASRQIKLTWRALTESDEMPLAEFDRLYRLGVIFRGRDAATERHRV